MKPTKLPSKEKRVQEIRAELSVHRGMGFANSLDVAKRFQKLLDILPSLKHSYRRVLK